ncbi:sulfatase-like hydrolase/transferase [Rhizobium sp. G187]|uniref:sulfatase-like hydrolase/transferase n=1 Tax=Rhizobium sp. G187 TaxID=3451352 RepID=UPI003EE490EE
MRTADFKRLDNYRPLRGFLWAAIFSLGLASSLGNLYNLTIADHLLAFSAASLFLYGLIKFFPMTICRVNLFWSVLSIVLFALWFVLYSLFGDIDLNAILFHFRYDVASNNVVKTTLHDAILAALPFAFMAVGWCILARMSAALRLINFCLPIVLIGANPLLWWGAQHALALSEPPPVDLGSHYVVADPPIQTSVRPKNLIHIFLESAESTFFDTSRFGNVADPLKRLSQEAWMATNIEQVEQTGWTLAGHVAATCGVPLFALGVIRENSFDLVDNLLPNARCLGDVLAKRGYQNVFLKGASLNFAGTRGFAANHGYQRLLGFDELHQRFPGRSNAWGLHDEDMFDVAYDEIRDLQREQGPFSVMLTTLGGHSPVGFISPACDAEPFVTSQPNHTLEGFACTNLLVERFVKRLGADGLLENTVVVIQSDHLAMRNEVYGKLNEQPRRNLLLVLGVDRQGVQTKPASTLDIFPTILQDLGIAPPQGRAGLGHALQTDDPTLVGLFGVAGVNRAIQDAGRLRDRLWGLDAPLGGDS